MNATKILITGGLGDIGRAIAAKFAAQGWRVALNDLAESTIAHPLLEQEGLSLENLSYFPADNTDRQAVKRMLDAVEQAGGLPQVVVVNAGVVQPMAFLEMTEENWRFHLEVNLTGAFHVAQEMAQRMVAAQMPGCILFTSSWVQDVAQAGIPAYCVSKSGLKMLAKTMALELASYGIRVNLVAPGIVDAGLSGRLFREGRANPADFTRLIPLGTLQTAAQVADVFWLLAQPEADYLTGATLVADGGMSLFPFRVERC